MRVSRQNRIAILAAGVLVLVVAGSVLATRSPGGPSQTSLVADDPESPPSAEDLAHAVERLQAKDLPTDALDALAQTYGLGGAVRLIAWSKETGRSVDVLAAMHDEGMGWGLMAKDLGVHPGIGWIMGKGNAGGNGLGRAHAPGQNRGADE
jgi:hypothetical protein